MNNLNSLILEGTVEKEFENSVIGLKVSRCIGEQIDVDYHFKIETANFKITEMFNKLKIGTKIRVVGYLSNLGTETVVTCEHIEIKR